MPLSPPGPRRPIHRRAIEIHGYARDDGLYDIEAELADTKTYPFGNLDRGTIEPGGKLHGMWLRLTVDEAMVIRACEASSDFTPYAVCPGAAPAFARLAGLAIGPGFGRAVKERVGGVQGCTHLRELLGQMATVAFQTIRPLVWKREREAREAAIARGEAVAPYRRPVAVGSCFAYAPDSPVVTRERAEVTE